MNCQHCQRLLLDHLYGLLDAQEAAVLDAHLASCPACAAASAETARVRGLIARAAKSAFPGTKFEPPAAQPVKGGSAAPAPGKTAVLSVPSGTDHKGRGFSRRAAAVLPWVIAAGVLFAIPGTVIPVLGIFKDADGARRDAEYASVNASDAAKNAETVKVQQKKMLTDAEFNFQARRQAEVAILEKWKEERESLGRSATARKFSVDVLKPQAIQPGAPNDFLVVVNDRRDPWETTDKNLVAEIHAVDASDAVIFTQPLNTERTAERRHPLHLPAGAWAKVRPNAELFLVVAQVDGKTLARTELQERIRLAGPVFATLLVTDKAAYRPGERLFFRSLTLDRITFKPPTREQILKYELLQSDGRTTVNGLTVTGTTDAVRVSAEGKVEPVLAADGQPVRGVGCGEFVLPADLPDGDYTLRLTEGQHPGGFPATIPVPVTRVVKVRSGPADVYRKEIGFARPSFVPGETVEAWTELKLQDKPVPNATVASVVAEADSEPLVALDFDKATDAKGRAKVQFALPPELLTADVRLKVTFRTPQGDEVVATRVPVIGNRVIVEFFPECGNTIIAGVPCKVYVRATTPAGQPVDFRGVVTDGRQTLAKVESLSDPAERGANRGLASFTYTPQLGTKVWLKLESPSAVYAPLLPGPAHNASVALLGGPGATAARTGFLLPRVEPSGVVMSVLDPVTAPGEPIRVQLHAVGQARNLVIGAYTRGQLSDTQKVTVEPEQPQVVKLMAGNDPRGGVVRITAFEEIDEKQDMKPIAERLVFRKPGEVLKLAFNAAPQVATGVPQAVPVPVAPQLGVAPPIALPAAPPVVPGNSPLACAITATNEKGDPVAAILWAAVVNSGVAPGAKDRLLPTHFLLAGEVKSPDELEYADFLLTDHPKAAEALDLLLGTQGWRRFAEQTAVPVVAQPPAQHPFGKPSVYTGAQQDAAKLMLQNGQYQTWTEPAPVRDYRELQRKFAPRYEAAVKAVAQAQAALDKAREESRDAQGVTQAAVAADAARRDADEKAAKAEVAREPVRKFRANVWYGVAGLAALALGCGLVSARRSAGRFPLGFSTLGSVGLAAFLVVAWGWGDDVKAAARDTTAQLKTAPPTEIEAAPAPHLPNALGMADGVAPGAQGFVPKTTKGAKDDLAKNGAAPDAVTPTADGKEPAAPPNVTPAAVAKAKTQNAKDYRPSFNPYPPPVIFPGHLGFGRNTAEPKNVGGIPPAPGHPVAPATPVNPVTLPTVPPPPKPNDPPTAPLIPLPAPAPGVTGWDPNGPNRVSARDIERSQRSLHSLLRKRTDATIDAAAKANELKKVAERAAGYALERGEPPGLPRGTNFFGLGARPIQPAGAGPYLAESFTAQQVRDAAPQPPLVVREYAAPRPGAALLANSIDSPDTVLWQPIIVLPADGKTVLNFTIGDARGGYEVVIAGHTADGRLGATRGMILVSPPKTLAPGTQAVPNAPALPPGVGAPPPPPMP